MEKISLTPNDEYGLDQQDIIITSFYHFFDLEKKLKTQRKLVDSSQDESEISGLLLGLKRKLLKFCEDIFIKGTLIIANEGMNGTMAGERNNISKLYQKLEEITDIKNIFYQETICKFYPFQKLKIKIKSEIVKMGVENLDINSEKGSYIESKDWDDFIVQKDVILVDTRNKYETRLGSFKNAIDPNTEYFREFPKWSQENLELFKDKKVAMVCTGGIRCEKSTSLLKKMGVKDVYHLKGGITQYLRDKEKYNYQDKTNWWGKCFIFDDRAVLDENLNNTNIYCKKCNELLSTRQLKHIKSECDILCLNCN